jgi:hypothetical protein
VFSTLRNASRTTTAIIAVGLVCTIGADIAMAAQGGSGTAAAAGRSHHAIAADNSAVAAYLRSLRPIAANVIAAVGPAEDVMDAIALPHAGDAFAARDALAHGDAMQRLELARGALARLHAPTELAAKQRDLITATRQMTTALKALHSLSSLLNGARIIAKIDLLSGSKLATAEGKWDGAIEAAYHASGASAPHDFTNYRHAPRSRTRWIFGADRACTAASFKLGDLRKLENVQTLASAEAWARRWARVLSFVGHRLTGLKQPTGASALPRLLRSRLKVLLFNSKVFSRQLAGLKNASFSAVEKTDEQIHEILPSLRALSAEMNGYGAHSCGLIIGLWGGKRPSTTSGGHHPRSVST